MLVFVVGGWKSFFTHNSPAQHENIDLSTCQLLFFDDDYYYFFHFDCGFFARIPVFFVNCSIFNQSIYFNFSSLALFAFKCTFCFFLLGMMVFRISISKKSDDDLIASPGRFLSMLFFDFAGGDFAVVFFLRFCQCFCVSVQNGIWFFVLFCRRPNKNAFVYKWLYFLLFCFVLCIYVIKLLC